MWREGQVSHAPAPKQCSRCSIRACENPRRCPSPCSQGDWLTALTWRHGLRCLRSLPSQSPRSPSSLLRANLSLGFAGTHGVQLIADWLLGPLNWKGICLRRPPPHLPLPLGPLLLIDPSGGALGLIAGNPCDTCWTFFLCPLLAGPLGD